MNQESGHRCRRCGQTKPADDFRPNWRLRSGRFWYCRDCQDQQLAESRAVRKPRLYDPARQLQRPDRWRPTKARMTRVIGILEEVRSRLEHGAAELTPELECFVDGVGWWALPDRRPPWTHPPEIY